MKVLKKYYKWIIALIVIIVITILSLLIYKNLFASGVSQRLDGIENHKLTKEEKKLVKDKLNELDSIDSIDISINSKIIKIFIVLEESIELKKVKEITNLAIQNFSEENLSFYDLEVFVECNDEEDEIYPKIGYKHKTNSEFTWNR